MPGMTEQAPDPFLATVVRHASRALQLAMASDWERAVAEIRALNQATGHAGVVQAMLAWIDTALSQSGRTEYGGQVRLKYLDVDTGLITGAEGPMRPAARWAGRLFAARLADDEDAFGSLIDAIPREPKAAGEHILAVLESTALIIRRVTSGESMPVDDGPGQSQLKPPHEER